MVGGAVMQTRFLLVAGFAESILAFRGSLIAALQARGLEVHVAAPNLAANDPACLELNARGVTVHCIPLRRAGTNPLADLETLCALWRLMRRVQPEFVMGYTIKPVIYGMFGAWLSGVPQRFALITGLGYAFTGDASGMRGQLRRLVQGLYRAALGRAHKVFFQNPDDEALFRLRGLLRPTVESYVVNGSGIDLDDFALVPLPSGRVHFLLIARLLGDKGVREYAQAAERIKVEHPEVQFSLVGWIDENPDAIKESELDVWVKAGVINYLGRLQDVRSAIATCSVYVLPSYREGTPRTVLEAMAMGRAVITTDAPGCRETVVDGDNGFLVPVQSVSALKQAMEKFIEDDSLARRMGTRSREIAEIKYDVHKVNAAMLNAMGIQ